MIGSLLLGVPDRGGLRYAGHVGTGFTQAMLTGLARRLAPLRRARSPFTTPVPALHAYGARWVQPRLVGTVAFTERTGRHTDHYGRPRAGGLAHRRSSRPGYQLGRVGLTGF